MNLVNKKILVTCGPTWIPIDHMRIISNKSSGEMGQTIAKDFAKRGAAVTLVEGPVNRSLRSKRIKLIKFQYYNELYIILKQTLEKPFDIVIHAAAVSDYQLKKAYKTKLSSQLKELQLNLVPTKKIIPLIKKWNPNTTLVGFKFVDQINKKIAIDASHILFKKSKCDLVIANSLNQKGYSGYIINQHNHFLAHKKTRQEISQELLKILTSKENLY